MAVPQAWLMRRMALLCFAFGAAMAISSETALARCGMFDVWEGDDVCVKCPGVRAEKIHMCPGGPAGLAVALALDTEHPFAYHANRCSGSS